MKNPFAPRPAPIDAQGITSTIERALASAGLDTTAGPMRGVMDTIRQALGAPSADPIDGPSDGPPTVLETVERVDPVDAGATAQSADTIEARAEAVVSGAMPLSSAQAGRFETHAFSNAAGTRNYKLYRPASRNGAAQAVVVMLHGCTQSPDDFALGTQMNRQADAHGLLVVYPEQSPKSNTSKCWNWFQPRDQTRDKGEPSLIAGIVAEVVAQHGADPQRIYVAGLSAGAAMAVVLGETYPEVFAGVGAHSGLPYASAHDIPSALATMKGGRNAPGPLNDLVGPARPAGAVQAVPVIVFHGDRDRTVEHRNATHIVDQATRAHHARGDRGALSAVSQVGQAMGGRRYSRTVHADDQGRAVIESWTLHGAGHAWSGGDARGTFTDASGPDASAEMVRFFLALAPAV